MGTVSFWDWSHDINLYYKAWSHKFIVMWINPKPSTLISCSNTCQLHHNKHAERLSNKQLAGLMQCHVSATHFSVCFFTVPRVLVVSGDTTSFAGFSSGTSGLGYLDAKSLQKQEGGKSLLKAFQPTLEHLPARREPTRAVRRPGFSRPYTRSTSSWMLADFPLQKHMAKFLHLSTEPRVGSRVSTISE